MPSFAPTLCALVVRLRTLLLLAAVGVITTVTVLLTGRPFETHVLPAGQYWPLHRGPNNPDNRLLDKLAIIFPVNNNTDMQFYRNMWFGDYLYPVCDWPAPGCKIVCNETSTYDTLDTKTFCFARAMKEFRDKEFFIKLDDDSFVDKDYIVGIMKQYTGQQRPMYISDHTWGWHDSDNPLLDHPLYGNGKFYMFNYRLAQCVDTELQYNGHENEDFIFGAMVRSGCGEGNVAYVAENDDYIWHKGYESKNKFIDLAYIKNH
ncbi:hypothetical protein IWQ56_000112 [Coemansia nantahalensis]|uniref:Uncharacterized protein n=1 Tax=Coemansia nantahalensis TaxID=2789366 RepID=A0ACC1JKR0_9FUNG|nr:hypothetical protein IWQ57_006150 [Coemansia nantahalensis]KAJ2775336.1 hypothetical protein IWQ56_000112 [Coemansia nantahalensis]